MQLKMAEQNLNPEELKALQERVSQMSPEELKEFQKKQCIFCQIASGKVQSKKIYEDDRVIAILDVNPANPGHAIVLTKEHYSIMPQIPDEETEHAFMIVKFLSNSMLRGIDAQGTNIIVSNGVAAGQRAQHFMAHIIPRKENDGVNFILPQKTLAQNEIEAIGDRLIAALGGGFLVKEEKPAKIQPLKPAFLPKGRESPKKESAGDVDLDDITRLLGAR